MTVINLKKLPYRDKKTDLLSSSTSNTKEIRRQILLFIKQNAESEHHKLTRQWFEDEMGYTSVFRLQLLKIS